jgi:thiol-disulfide isomerase/thioredoxin
MPHSARQTWAIAPLALLLLASSAHSAEGPTRLPAKDAGIGHRIPDLSFIDLDGKSAKLSDLREAKAIALCLTSTTCPVSKKYGPTLVQLASDYQPKGVVFIAINVGRTEHPAAMKDALARAREAGFKGHYVADRDHTLAKALAPRTTTEVLVIDRARTLVYRGAVDDQYGLGYSVDAPRANYLKNALDAVLADDRPNIEATTAPGCALDFERGLAASAASSSNPITYHNRISRLLQNNCNECHRPGEPAPFTLTSHADVKDHAPMIKKVVAKNIMPPWHAKADPENPNTFLNDRSLSDADKADLIKWLESGAPEGNPADAPIQRKWVQGWRMGQPDLILQAPQPQTIPASGTIPYRYVMVPTKLTEDKWVQSMEVRPTAPEVVHHILVFVELPRTDPRRQQFRGHRGGTAGYFAGMVPGQGHITFPDGAAKLLPKGATLVFQIHYTTNGQPATDRPRIGFKFAKEKPAHEIITAATSNRTFEIPPHADNHEVTATHTFFQPVRILSVNPHSHVRGKAFKYELIHPDGQTQVILDVPRYDFNWQLEYQFAKPLEVSAGARLRVTGWYDNSKNNPANPDPAKPVKWGDQTWNEMMIGYFTGYVLKGEEKNRSAQ